MVNFNKWVYENNFLPIYPIGTFFMHSNITDNSEEILELISNNPLIFHELETTHLWYIDKNRKNEQLWNLILERDLSIGDVIRPMYNDVKIIIKEESFDT